jgi:hypothetical protein
MPLPTHWLLDGNHLVLPFPWVSIGFKSTWKGEACSLPPDSTWAPPCSPLYFPSLIFNKLHLYPCVLPWILPHRTKNLEVFWSQTPLSADSTRLWIGRDVTGGHWLGISTSFDFSVSHDLQWEEERTFCVPTVVCAMADDHARFWHHGTSGVIYVTPFPLKLKWSFYSWKD